MGKKYTLPDFLQHTLSETKKALVEKFMDEYIDSVKPDRHGNFPTDTVLMYKYCDFLGKKDRDFKKLDHNCLKTTFAGVWDVYNPLRKRFAYR